jgi:hypothetical protein
MDLDHYRRARKSDPDTSHEAAASIGDLRERQKVVLAIFDWPGVGFMGTTDEELGDAYQRLALAGQVPYQSPSGLRTRRSELVELGLVENSGDKRKTRSGRRAIVWQKPAGRG